jgi:hypothetical protein
MQCMEIFINFEITSKMTHAFSITSQHHFKNLLAS